MTDAIVIVAMIEPETDDFTIQDSVCEFMQTNSAHYRNIRKYVVSGIDGNGGYDSLVDDIRGMLG